MEDNNKVVDTIPAFVTNIHFDIMVEDFLDSSFFYSHDVLIGSGSTPNNYDTVGLDSYIGNNYSRDVTVTENIDGGNYISSTFTTKFEITGHTGTMRELGFHFDSYFNPSEVEVRTVLPEDIILAPTDVYPLEFSYQFIIPTRSDSYAYYEGPNGEFVDFEITHKIDTTNPPVNYFDYLPISINGVFGQAIFSKLPQETGMEYAAPLYIKRRDCHMYGAYAEHVLTIHWTQVNAYLDKFDNVDQEIGTIWFGETEYHRFILPIPLRIVRDQDLEITLVLTGENV